MKDQKASPQLLSVPMLSAEQYWEDLECRGAAGRAVRGRNVINCGVHMEFLFFPLISKTTFRVEQEKIFCNSNFSVNPLLRKIFYLVFLFSEILQKKEAQLKTSDKKFFGGERIPIKIGSCFQALSSGFF